MQISTAFGLERVCRSVGCQFIVNTGDNFYECVSHVTDVDDAAVCGHSRGRPIVAAPTCMSSWPWARPGDTSMDHLGFPHTRLAAACRHHALAPYPSPSAPPPAPPPPPPRPGLPLRIRPCLHACMHAADACTALQGLDHPLRWKTDFESIYQGPSTPFVAKLKWLNTFGNHDIVADGATRCSRACTLRCVTQGAPVPWPRSKLYIPAAPIHPFPSSIHTGPLSPLLTVNLPPPRHIRPCPLRCPSERHRTGLVPCPARRLRRGADCVRQPLQQVDHAGPLLHPRGAHQVSQPAGKASHGHGQPLVAAVVDGGQTDPLRCIRLDAMSLASKKHATT